MKSPSFPALPSLISRTIWSGVILVLLVIAAVVFFSGLHIIGPSEIGLKFNKGGSARGLSQTSIVSGYTFVNSLTTQIITYPRGQQNYSWTRAENEGHNGDESFTFNSSDQVVLNADVNIGYQVRPEDAPAIYVRFGPSIDVITHNYIRSVVRNAITRQASNFTAEDLLGKGRAAFEDASQKEIEADLQPGGFEVRNFSFIGELRAPAAIVQSINAKFAAQQAALQAQNKVVQATAEAQQAVATAKGRAASILLEAQAQAQANRVLAASLTPELVQTKAIEHWNGAMPQYVSGSGSATPSAIFNLPTQTIPQSGNSPAPKTTGR